MLSDNNLLVSMALTDNEDNDYCDTYSVGHKNRPLALCCLYLTVPTI